MLKFAVALSLGFLIGEAHAHIMPAMWGWYWSVNLYPGAIRGEELPWEAYVIYDDQCPPFGAKCGFFDTFLQHR